MYLGSLSWVVCQPKVSSHDYLIVFEACNNRSDLTCNLSLKSKEVAPILRQVQIWLNQNQEESVAFVLTNSLDWSFGMAKNRDKESVSHYNISTARVGI